MVASSRCCFEKYKNRNHGRTRKILLEVSSGYNRIDPPNSTIKPKQPKFQESEYKSVPDKGFFYGMGYTTNWNIERFKIHQCIDKSEVTYILGDENTEQSEIFAQTLLGSNFKIKPENKTLESMNISHQME